MFRCLSAVVFLVLIAQPSFGEEARPRVGMLLPMSGDFAAIGVDGRNGVDLALREFGSPAPIEIIFGDTRGEPTTAVSEFRKVTDSDRVSAVYIFRGPVGMAVNPLSKQSRIPLLGGVGNKAFAQKNEYAFQLWPPSDVEGAFLANNVTKRGFQTISMVSAEDDWTVSVSDAFKEAFKGKILFEQSLANKDSDFRALILQLRRADADAIFVNLSIAQIGTFLRQLRDQGVTKPVFSNFWCGKAEVIQAAGAAAEGVMFAEMSLADLPKFRESIAAQGGGTASGATLSAYVGTKLLLQAAASAHPRNAEEFYRALLAQREVALADRTLSISGRVVEFPLGMKVIQGGQGKVAP